MDLKIARINARAVIVAAIIGVFATTIAAIIGPNFQFIYQKIFQKNVPSEHESNTTKSEKPLDITPAPNLPKIIIRSENDYKLEVIHKNLDKLEAVKISRFSTSRLPSLEKNLNKKFIELKTPNIDYALEEIRKYTSQIILLFDELSNQESLRNNLALQTIIENLDIDSLLEYLLLNYQTNSLYNYYIAKTYECLEKYNQSYKYYIDFKETTNVNRDILLDMAHTARKLEKYDDSINLLNEIIKIDELANNKFHQAENYNNLGELYLNIGQYEPAEVNLFKAREIINHLPKNHLEEKNKILSNLAATSYKLGKYKEAISIYNAILKNSDLKNIGSTVTYSNNLGEIYNFLGKYDLATDLLENAIALCSKSKCLISEDHAITLNNLGNVYFNNKNIDKSITYFNQALARFIDIYGHEHSSVSRIYNSLGRIYLEKNETERAINYFKQSLNIEELIFKKQHPDLAIIHKNLAFAFGGVSNFNQAIFHIQKALEINKSFFKQNHLSYADIYIVYALICKIQKDEKSSIFYLNKAKDIYISNPIVEAIKVKEMDQLIDYVKNNTSTYRPSSNL